MYTHQVGFILGSDKRAVRDFQYGVSTGYYSAMLRGHRSNGVLLFWDQPNENHENQDQPRHNKNVCLYDLPQRCSVIPLLAAEFVVHSYSC